MSWSGRSWRFKMWNLWNFGLCFDDRFLCLVIGSRKPDNLPGVHNMFEHMDSFSSWILENVVTNSTRSLKVVCWAIAWLSILFGQQDQLNGRGPAKLWCWGVLRGVPFWNFGGCGEGQDSDDQHSVRETPMKPVREKTTCRVIWSTFFLGQLRANRCQYLVFISPQTSGSPAILHDTLRILAGDVKMLRLLTESRADINARTQGLGHLGYYDSMTPLMIATRSNQRLGFEVW